MTAHPLSHVALDAVLLVADGSWLGLAPAQLVAGLGVLLALVVAIWLHRGLPRVTRFTMGLTIGIGGLVTAAAGVVVAIIGVDGALLGGVGIGFVLAVVGVVLVLTSKGPDPM